MFVFVMVMMMTVAVFHSLTILPISLDRNALNGTGPSYPCHVILGELPAVLMAVGPLVHPVPFLLVVLVESLSNSYIDTQVDPTIRLGEDTQPMAFPLLP
jgi:hypothetical protein